LRILSVRPEAITSWITGIFRFENNTLSEITQELERAFHVKIHIEDEVMRNKTFNAVFEDKETLDEILSILQISAKYKMEKKRGEVYLR
jgi:ferric-dicitrate binding protein FerR (iron transport regulator)